MDADDRGEQPSLMEPLLIGEASRHRSYLIDLAFDLGAAPESGALQPAYDRPAGPDRRSPP
jgi:hypothetical protein